MSSEIQKSALPVELVDENLRGPHGVRLGMYRALMVAGLSGHADYCHVLRYPKRADPLPGERTRVVDIRSRLDSMSSVGDRPAPRKVGVFVFHGVSVLERKELTVLRIVRNPSAGQLRGRVELAKMGQGATV